MDLLYKKHRRAKVGRCNICGQVKRLSWDHVPPKGGIELQAVEIDSIAGNLWGTANRPEISQNGLKYRTLCSRCNSLLGTSYDPYLNEFAISVGRFLRTSLELPRVLHVPAQPTAIARAVLGHILAARMIASEAYFDPMIRDVVFDPAKQIPKEINIFYWIYPYAQQIVFREGLMPAKRGNFQTPPQRFNLLKYFPVAYLITDIPEYEGLESLTLWRNEPANQVIDLPIRLARVHDAFWPEAPARDNCLFLGEEGMQSVRAHPRGREWEEKGLIGTGTKTFLVKPRLTNP